jgi:hypothetical protein
MLELVRARQRLDFRVRRPELMERLRPLLLRLGGLNLGAGRELAGLVKLDPNRVGCDCLCESGRVHFGLSSAHQRAQGKLLKAGFVADPDVSSAPVRTAGLSKPRAPPGIERETEWTNGATIGIRCDWSLTLQIAPAVALAKSS